MAVVVLRMRKGRLPLNPSYHSRSRRRRRDAHPRGLDAITRSLKLKPEREPSQNTHLIVSPLGSQLGGR